VRIPMVLSLACALAACTASAANAQTPAPADSTVVSLISVLHRIAGDSTRLSRLPRDPTYCGMMSSARLKEVLFVVDGRPIPRGEAVPEPDRIRSSRFLAPRDAIRRYGEAGANGAMEIRLKPAPQP
jgi:hypothetical protein